MKKLVATSVLFGALLFGFSTAKAQTYKTGAGLLVDVGEGSTLVGPHVKHFFTRNSAGEFALLFGDHTTTIQGLYQYNQGISGAKGLQWYLGMGPAVSFGEHHTWFSLVPVLGLDYKVSGAPVDLFFDWRPRAVFDEHDSDFLAGRFGLGMRITF